jgi:hypothetical protein
MPRLFVSCASAELAEYRDRLVADLRRTNVDVKAHDEVRAFNSGLTTLEKLDDYIQGCAAIIHLVGDGTGAEVEAAQLDAIGRRYPDLATKLPPLGPLLTNGAGWRGSYTQWEAYLAIYHIVCGRLERCYVYRAAESVPRASGFSADDVGRLRQTEHYERLAALGRDRQEFASREDLRVAVLNHLLDVLSQRSAPLKAEPSKLWKLQTKPDSVFEGREQVLANLDALWADTLIDKSGRAHIVSLVAIGGAGKTTVASRWKDSVLGREFNGGVERYFDWSFYSQGTREGDNVSAQSAADATVFVAAALTFFGRRDFADSPAPAWDKGALLATLVAEHRTLLILDGLEPLQHPPGPQTGELKDDAIRALFEGLKSASRGLCIVTTRESITDLATTLDTTTPEWPLDHLTDVAGALVLKGHGVTGPDDELRLASREVKGHALTLGLMGRYLELAFEPPDIAKRDCFQFEEADAETKNGHAFRVFAAYERWFEGKPARQSWWQRWFGRKHKPTTDQTALAILRLLGLFDRPATPDCLAALCATPAIPGLTESLVGLDEKQWNTALERLRELDLVETVDWAAIKVTGYGEREARAEMAAAQRGHSTDLGPPQLFEPRHLGIVNRRALDAHPLLREYFDARLQQEGLAPSAHGRLYEHLCANVPYWPEGRDGLLPLYQAVAHGCRAGRIEGTSADVYRDRIQRGTTGTRAFYSSRRLGLYGPNLRALACFFVQPWRELSSQVTPAAQGWLLNETAVSLRALNRLSEAREPMSMSIERATRGEAWDNASRGASNLSQLELALGDLSTAEAIAAQSVVLADRSGDSFLRVVARSTHAEAHLHLGSLEDGRTLFTKAEELQAEHESSYALLYSVQGARFCTLLLEAASHAAWRQVAGFEAAPGASGRSGDLADEALGGRANHTVNLLLELDAVERRVSTTLTWAESGGLGPASRGLDQLTLGRVHLLRELVQDSERRTAAPDLLEAGQQLNIALTTLRQAGQNHLLPPALLDCAWLNAVSGQWDVARQRLDEALALATRGANPTRGWEGGMRLHLVDTLLYRARLFGWLKDESRRPAAFPRPPAEYPWPGRTPRMDLEEAATLIEACGYHRRDAELADAMDAIA